MKKIYVLCLFPISIQFYIQWPTKVMDLFPWDKFRNRKLKNRNFIIKIFIEENRHGAQYNPLPSQKNTKISYIF